MEDHGANFQDVDASKETQWRRYGQAFRRELLEKDKNQGGTDFHLNPSCSIDRYFLISRRALEQFHKMYKSGSDNEATYVMGHRMICFLAIFLPQHPDYLRRRVSADRVKSIQELEQLQQCLEDVAIRIDEEQLNTFITDDFDPIPDDDSDCSVEDDGTFPVHRQHQHATKQQRQQDPSHGKWEPFANMRPGDLERQLVDSPTADTVATTDSEDDSDRESIRRRRSDFEETGHHQVASSYVFRLDEYFLDKIANEDVKYEIDSEAADSWAQDGDSSSVAMSASSGAGITYDPARIALREVFNRIPKTLTTSAPSPVKEEEPGQISVDTSAELLQEPSPTKQSKDNSSKLVENVRTAQRTYDKQQQDKENGIPMPESPRKQGGELEFFGVFPDVLDQDEWVSFDNQESSRRLAHFGSPWNGPSC